MSVRSMKGSAFALPIFAAIVAAELQSKGASVTLNGTDYYIPPFSQGVAYNSSANAALLKSSHFGFIPVTVVASPEHDVQTFAKWSVEDDVWQPAFLETAVFFTESANASSLQNLESTVLQLHKSCNVPSGPYFMQPMTGELFQAYRLYDDFAGAFTQSVIQSPDGKFQPLSAQTAGSASLTIGVPSRLYYTPTVEKPLAGVRVGVKDLFSLAGLKRSNGNRAWYGLYPPHEMTSPIVQNLIDAGAIVVGGQKLSQFANGETATADWVDFHAPFNPRFDGYLDASSSSSAAGASVASYDWLDIALGSDTGGSVRGPANVQGLFGNRPTHGISDLTNAMPLSPTLDSAGFLVRDPAIWDTANAAMYKGNYTSFAQQAPRYPKTLYALGLPTSNTSAAQTIRTFASDLASFLGTNITSMDLNKEWNSSGPEEARNQSLEHIFNTTYATFISKEQTRLVRDPFYKDYAAAHEGRLPFIDPVVKARWAYGDSLPQNAHADALHNKTIFMSWFNEKILPPVSDPLMCSSSIMLHAAKSGEFIPRNVYLQPPHAPFGFSNAQISMFAEVPDSVYPIGESSAYSSITNHTELLPVTIDVVVARGCDGLLVKLAQDLVAAGILRVPKVGRDLEGGEILLRRDTD